MLLFLVYVCKGNIYIFILQIFIEKNLCIGYYLTFRNIIYMLFYICLQFHNICDAL